MTYTRKRIALLFCGGTTMDERDRRGDSVTRPSDVPLWMERLGEIQMIAHVEPHFLYGHDASGIGPAHWRQLAERIAVLEKNVDGICVLHQVETLPFAAAAVAYLLAGSTCPIVITGSPLLTRTDQQRQVIRPWTTSLRREGVRANVMNALHAVSTCPAGVTVVWGNRLIPGTQAVFSEGAELRLDSYNSSFVGKFDFGTQVAQPKRRSGSSASRRRLPFADRVLTLSSGVAGLDHSLTPDILRRQQGLFISLGKPPILPAALSTLVARALQLKIPVCLYAPAWSTPPAISGVLSLTGLSRIAAQVKFQWVLAQASSRTAQQHLLDKPRAGEFGGSHVKLHL